MELEQFATNEQVEGSSPFVPSKFYGFVAQWNQSAGLLNLMLRVRVAPEPPFRRQK